jgi:hypothetical protein
MHRQPGSLILVPTQGMGQAERSLQRTLIEKYLTLLDENDMLPGAIGFYAEGVKLVLRDSPVLAALQSLEAKGVHLLVCQTCLNHFGAMDQVAVGIVAGMTDILAAQWKADKVITL